MTKPLLFILFATLSIACVGCKPEKPEAHAPTPQTDAVDEPNEPTWGPPFNGLSVSVTPKKPFYGAGDDIRIALTIRNDSQETVEFPGFASPAWRARMVLYDRSGQAVPLTERSLNRDRKLAEGGPDSGSRSITYLEPGKTWSELFSVDEFYAINSPGTYHLAVIREIADWNKGFLISNLTTLKIVE